MVIFFNKLVPDAKREKIVWLWQNFNIKMQFKTETEEKEEAKFQKSAKYLLLHTFNLLSNWGEEKFWTTHNEFF